MLTPLFTFKMIISENKFLAIVRNTCGSTFLIESVNITNRRDVAIIGSVQSLVDIYKPMLEDRTYDSYAEIAADNMMKEIIVLLFDPNHYKPIDVTLEVIDIFAKEQYCVDD